VLTEAATAEGPETVAVMGMADEAAATKSVATEAAADAAAAVAAAAAEAVWPGAAAAGLEGSSKSPERPHRWHPMRSVGVGWWPAILDD
jgi:hypothetical protein